MQQEIGKGCLSLSEGIASHWTQNGSFQRRSS